MAPETFAKIDPMNFRDDESSFSSLSTPHPGSSDSQGSTSSEGLNSFNPCVEKNALMDANSNFHDFGTHSGTRIPKLTLNMVIERKRLAAQRSFERLFGAKNQQTVPIQ